MSKGSLNTGHPRPHGHGPRSGPGPGPPGPTRTRARAGARARTWHGHWHGHGHGYGHAHAHAYSTQRTQHTHTDRTHNTHTTQHTTHNKHTHTHITQQTHSFCVLPNLHEASVYLARRAALTAIRVIGSKHSSPGRLHPACRHASIVAQCSAVRILTQFVRLPIPTWEADTMFQLSA